MVPVTQTADFRSRNNDCPDMPPLLEVWGSYDSETCAGAPRDNNQIQSQNSLTMDFAQHDQVIQAYTADGADDSISVVILPGRSQRSGNFVDPHASHSVLEIVFVDAIPIAIHLAIPIVLIAKTCLQWKR